MKTVKVHPGADAISDKHTKGTVDNKQIDSEVPTNGGSDPGTPNPAKGGAFSNKLQESSYTPHNSMEEQDGSLI